MTLNGLTFFAVVRMAQRKGMFAAFADDDEEAFQPAKPVKKTTVAPVKVEDKKVERP